MVDASGQANVTRHRGGDEIVSAPDGQDGKGASINGGHADSAVRRYKWLEASALPLLFLAMLLAFGAIEPRTFVSLGNAASVLGTNTVLVGLMVAAMIPLIVGDFDLSVGASAGLGAMVLAVLNANDHIPVLAAALTGVAAAVVVGAVNALFVVYFRNDAFIVTLASGTAVTGLVFWISGAQTIAGTSASLGTWVFTNSFLGIPLQFYYGIALVVAGWYVLEMTPLGQRVTFVGQSRSVAHLSGIRVARVRVGAFLFAGLAAGLAGVVIVGTAGSADPTSGPNLLLPALAAAFLGSTTVRPGRLNMFGAFIAVYFLAFGVDGLELLGVQNWVQDLFYGAALIVAVTTSQLIKRRAG